MYHVYMTMPTTTIRVPRSTRDKLTEVARDRGVSVSQLLTDQAVAWTREEWFRKERDAGRTVTAATQAEQDLWEGSDDDWD